jgi:spore maturation protein CgeB
VSPLDVVVVGLSLSSSWGNGHASTYRALLQALAARGHRVTFLERDVPWYAAHRDLPEPSYARLVLYDSLEELARRHDDELGRSDLVVVGSFVPDGQEVIDWALSAAGGLTAFYDIDTPATLAAIQAGTCSYLAARQIPGFDLYLSFTGGPTLSRLERQFGARRARAFYCSFDPRVCYPEPQERRWELGYLGTYSPDRQPALERLLLEPARRRPDQRFVVAGSLYPDELSWPANVERIPHLPPAQHRAFYCQQRFTLNLTRADMVAAGHSPSVRLFEAAGCGVPIISDPWPGLETLFAPGREILLAHSTEDVIRLLSNTTEEQARRLGEHGRRRVVAGHTAEHRAQELERLVLEASASPIAAARPL